MTRGKTSRRLALALGALLAVTACTDPTQQGSGGGEDAGSSTGGGGGDAGEDVVIATGGEPDSFNPVLGYARWGDGKIVEGLVRLTADLEPEPLLATEMPEVSADGLTYTFTLRDDVTFHDGSALDAQDVVATYETAIDPETASPVAADLTALELVEAVDDSTVRFTLSQPQSSFVAATVLGIVPSESLDPEPAASADVVGTGPYAIETYRSGERIVLEGYDDYWGEQPEVQRATFVFVEDDAARAARVASGEVDGALLPAQALDRVEQDDEFEVVRRDTADFRALVMPEENPVAGDPAIREALDEGLDRQALVDGALAGAGRPAYGPIPPEAPEYSDVVEVETDVQAAEAALDEAGWVEQEDGTRARDGQAARFTLMYPAGDTLRQNIALAVQSQAAELGIQVEPEGLSWEAIEPRMREDALVYGSGNPYNADLSTYPLFHSSRAFQGFDNPGGYMSDAMDAALEEGRSAMDEDERVEAYQQVQEQLAEDLPWVFLVYVEHDYVIRADTWSGWDVPLVEPHEHGLQGGPWWNLPAWTTTTTAAAD
ncbi:Dipeptide-binding ABC transporter, periplasmic substrate-binding component [Serinicoccus hydrothermalis]|uniref:Dipeptide-binding ABC transporter, periplasmic substrate-binding component n=2 Tax=Serinicoccus hydrothermalis TaxID=1758689 RepID=A0A1B1NGS2_9MICO|nr:Dipeptide-binding ABC transporter, periplasmic substrate-binding component [Serinicoccus hydrothermalis]